jgi:H+-transporting ATPase
MTLAIVVFNFYPLTAVMIVMLALLNDGAILSIAYDNVHYRNAPEAWNMRTVLGVSTVLGVVGVVAAFGLFYLAERVLHIDRSHIQTLMYLKLSVAGHLTIFMTRTRGPWWSIRPARILLIAVFGTQALATLVAVYGAWIVPPLGWKLAGMVWVYAISWFLITDPVKLLVYRILDHFGASKDSTAVDRKPAAPVKPKSKPAPAKGKAADAKPDVVTAPLVAAQPKQATGAPAPAVATLLDTNLGDVLLASLLQHPDQAGKLIAEEIAQGSAPATEAQPAKPAPPPKD